MAKKLNIKSGEIYGRLTVLKEAVRLSKSRRRFLCKCVCGNLHEVDLSHLKSGAISSCGCLKQEGLSEYSRTHGQSKTKLYQVWSSMKRRCIDPKSNSYKRYGAIGVTICKEWMDFTQFYRWAKLNGYNEGLSIDRINNLEGYSPDNCRWADNFTQAQNKNSNKNISYKGKTMCLAKWARETGISESTLYSRFRNGWDAKDIISIKPGSISNYNRNEV